MRSVIAALLTVLAVPAWAQQAGMVSGADAVKWGPAPPVLPKGAEIAVLAGDPAKEGPFVVRLRLPADYKIPAHSHPTLEDVTVLSGNLHAGMGDKLDPSKGNTLAPGGFVSMPAGMHHFAWANEPTVIQINSTGPFAINYVNPADDPTKAQ